MVPNITIKKAIFLNAVAKYSIVIIQLIYTAILSRLLSPEEFGIIAVMNVFIAFFQLVADMGFGTAIIQRKDLSKDDINSIFSVMVYIGIFLCILFMILSYPISLIYKDRIYISLGCVISFSLFFNALNSIPNALILKEKRFSTITVRTVVVYITSAMITIIFALKGFGVYALAIYSVVTALLLFIWNKWNEKVKFIFIPDMNVIKKIWTYSIFQFGSQAINYFSRNLDNLFVGKFFSTIDLGYYNKSYTLMMYPISYIPGVITPVLHPVLSEYQNDKEYIYIKYMELIKILSIIGCFVSIFCFFSAKELIYIVFGDQWNKSVLPFKLLSISLICQLLTNTIAPIYQSVGNTKLMFESTIITTLTIILMIIIGVVIGNINSVAACVCIGYLLNFLITFKLLISKCFNMQYTKFLSSFKEVLLIYIILLLCSFVYPLEISNYLISLTVKFFFLFTIYIILLIITKQYKIFLKLLKFKI